MPKSNSFQPGKHFLQIPGPTNVPDRVLRAMDYPTIDHRGPEFAEIAKRVLDKIKLIFSNIPKGGGGFGWRPTNIAEHANYDNGDANTGGGAGATDGAGTSGGSGVVILKYPSTKTISVGAGLTSTTDTEGSNKITTFTAGTGNVSWA